MSAAQGDAQKADYFLDCGVYEYYSRLLAQKRYGDMVKEQMKKSGSTE